jgi:hypothetical protein
MVDEIKALNSEKSLLIESKDNIQTQYESINYLKDELIIEKQSLLEIN